MTGIQKQKVDWLSSEGFEFMYQGENVIKLRKFLGNKIRLAFIDEAGRITFTTTTINQKGE